MQLPKSTETIDSTIPLYVKGIFEKTGKLPTKSMIYQMMKTKQKNEPHLFGNSSWNSTYGSTRSRLSEVCKNIPNRKLKDVYSFDFQGVDYFYTDINQVYELAASANALEEIEDDYQFIAREHCNIQYELSGIFTKIGCKIWIPNQDSNGEKSKTKYEQKTINETYGENVLKMTTQNPFYWIDFVVFENDKPILQLEVEESTNVLKGMERMSQSKEFYNDIKSFVTSTKVNYQDLFNKVSTGTYKNLSANFINRNVIDKLYKKSKTTKDIENFRKIVFKEFGL